uniref:BTB domain-containing protein n=1 Tax=Panagrolaimus davidi TaxID=227884 RepID=A0A914P231_9BILA
MVPKSSLKNDDKDFLIVIGEKEIQIHKQMLSDVSPVIDAMLKSGMKEAVENKMIIVDFPFKIVDVAINLLYGGRGTCKFVLEDLLLLYIFADKYRIQFIMESLLYMYKFYNLIVFKDFAEYHLIKHISPSNVVQLTKFSDPDSFNITKIHQSCTKFLIKCFKKEIPVYAYECLEKDLVFKTFVNGFCPTMIN